MCWRDSVPDEGLMLTWTAWIYHTVAASGRGGGGGKSAQPANNGVWDCDSNSNRGADGSQRGRHTHTAHMKGDCGIARSDGDCSTNSVQLTS